jgi:hypothetical protein
VTGLALLSTVVLRAEMVEGARILRTCVSGTSCSSWPPLPAPDSKSRLPDEKPSLVDPLTISKAGKRMSGPGVTAARINTETMLSRLRKLFGSMLFRGGNDTLAGDSRGLGVDRSHIFGSMLPRGIPIPPAGIPSPTHN